MKIIYDAVKFKSKTRRESLKVKGRRARKKHKYNISRVIRKPRATRDRKTDRDAAVNDDNGLSIFVSTCELYSQTVVFCRVNNYK